MEKLTRQNQGYYDRLQRARSWLERAQTIAHSAEEWEDYGGQFIVYWIALNALYARDVGERRSDQKDFRWFIELICSLDQQQKLREALDAVKRKAEGILENKFLFEWYWEEGTTTRVIQAMKEEARTAQAAWNEGQTARYMLILLRRLRMLRNQILHDCSTDRRSLNRDSLRPAVGILEALVPTLIDVMEQTGKGKDWPPIPYPRARSPQNPDSIRHRQAQGERN